MMLLQMEKGKVGSKMTTPQTPYYAVLERQRRGLKKKVQGGSICCMAVQILDTTAAYHQKK